MKRTLESIVAACILLSVLGGVWPAGAQTQTDLNGYIARLSSASQTLRAPGVDPGAAIEAARTDLGLPIVVSLPEGASVAVTEESLLGPSGDGSDADAVAAMETRLEAALAAASRAGTEEPPDRAEVDDAVAAAYGGLALDPPSWDQRLLSRIGQALGWFLDHTLGALLRSGAGSFVGWLLVVGLAVGGILLAQRVRLDVVADARWYSGGQDVVSVDWQRYAEDALAAGDLNAAVPALYHVLVGTLARRGVVRDAPSLTAGECRGAVRATRPVLAPSIDRATAVFERVAYGKQEADLDDVETLRAAERAVRGRG